MNCQLETKFWIDGLRTPGLGIAMQPWIRFFWALSDASLHLTEITTTSTKFWVTEYSRTVVRYFHVDFIYHFSMVYVKYSRTSVARTLMARLPPLFRTGSWAPYKKHPIAADIIVFGIFAWFSFYIDNGILCVLSHLDEAILMRPHNIPTC